jgi:hypothetical protein
MLRYEGYSIRTFEEEPGRWFAEMRRLDGKRIKAVGGDNIFDKLTTSHATVTEEAAITEAKACIDGGAMRVVD